MPNMSKTVMTGTILDKIIADKQKRLQERKTKITLEELSLQANNCKTTIPNFARSLRRGNSLSIIGEIKKASPSRGIIQPNFNPADQARAYQSAGISAISVLTEEDHFLGSDNYLREAASAVSLPILRKDFIVDPYQIYEARLLGASAILLICAVLDQPLLQELLNLTHNLGMQALVEVHNLNELMMALDSQARIIGINNRDLHSFHVDLATTERLAGVIPAGRIVVAESGIATSADMARIYRAGAHAVLIGETLMRAAGTDNSIRGTIDLLYGDLPGQAV
jgi:indole-3-glycerol phosphate synthase